ncbi:hypothetical protein BOTBODRAFT_558091 [Botryobasidium botryosum FD-172 SS1]|uniref:Uncharacterized protein n=1 Tax=Botryobasidium botryosum (strain FD-172 SS1) TaxID=930990 RepID=A0A067LZA9_BOTB1|nr:hypothetical protein BOTBODRAFT_558091 [Botryobasidium botryosum FD-172 SS1]
MSTYFAQHPQPSSFPLTAPKMRQEGFHVQSASSAQPPSPGPSSPTNPLDASLFFGQQMFPDSFRKFNNDHQVDINETLASMISPGHFARGPGSTDSGDRSTQSSVSQTHIGNDQHHPLDLQGFSQHQQQQHQQQAHNQLFNSHYQPHIPFARPPRDEIDSQSSQSREMFFDHPPNEFHSFSATGLQRLQLNTNGHSSERPDTPSSIALPSPADTAFRSARSPSSTGASRSRSRTRSSKAPSLAHRGISKKRASISSPSPPVIRPSPPPGSRPQAIMIPSANGGHPMSPMGLHMPGHSQTAPTTWFLPPHASDYIPGSDPLHQVHPFGQFAGHSVPKTGPMKDSMNVEDPMTKQSVSHSATWLLSLFVTYSYFHFRIRTEPRCSARNAVAAESLTTQSSGGAGTTLMKKSRSCRLCSLSACWTPPLSQVR